MVKFVRMNIKELRIGSITKQGVVMEMRQNAVRVLYTSDREKIALIEYEIIEPIPITEQALIELGFKANTDPCRKEKYNIKRKLL